MCLEYSVDSLPSKLHMIMIEGNARLVRPQRFQRQHYAPVMQLGAIVLSCFSFPSV